MSTISKILVLAGLAVVGIGASAQAQPYHAWNHGNWDHGYYRHWDHRWDRARWHEGGYWGPRYYYSAPPVVAYPPPAYYGPPSLNFNIPLG